MTTFGSLRWGEVTALRRVDVDESHDVVRVRCAFSSGTAVRSSVGSRSHERACAPSCSRVRSWSCSQRTSPSTCDADPDTLVFTGDKGGPMQRGNFNKRVKWAENVAAVGAPGLHFHDLRHTGNTFAAMTGASLRDLMTRMGHDSMRAALIYQHNTQGADRKIADAMEALIVREVDAASVRAPTAQFRRANRTQIARRCGGDRICGRPGSGSDR